MNFGFSGFNGSLYTMFPYKVMCGMLSPGGSLSKLNNLQLSGGTSPFSSGTAEVSGLNASLPGITNFSRPVSIFAQTGFQKKNVPFSGQLSCFYSPEEQITALSSYVCYTIKKDFVIKGSATVGQFPYSENSSSSWTVKEPYYYEGTHLCSLFQLSLALHKLFWSFSTGLYETPFGTLEQALRTDLKLPAGHFTFYASGFYNPNNSLLTSADKKIKDCFQIKTGLKYKCAAALKQPVFFSSGANVLINADTSGTEHPVKINAGLQLLTSLTTVSLSSSLHYVLDTTIPDTPAFNFKDVSFQLKNNWNLKKLSPCLSFSTTLTPNADFSDFTKKFSFRLSTTITKNSKKTVLVPKVSAYTGFSHTIKANPVRASILSSQTSSESQTSSSSLSIPSSSKITAGCTTSLTIKSFTCTFRFSADVDI